MESEYIKAFEQLKQQYQRSERVLNDFKASTLSAEELYKQIFGEYPQGGRVPPYSGGYKTYDPFSHRQGVGKQTIGRDPEPPASTDPVERRAEIEKELEIIRGRVPTPKGYTINPLRIKQLMAELKQLNKT